jgi:hypothetical protein
MATKYGLKIIFVARSLRQHLRPDPFENVAKSCTVASEFTAREATNFALRRFGATEEARAPALDQSITFLLPSHR